MVSNRYQSLTKEYESGILLSSAAMNSLAREEMSRWLQTVFGQVPQVGLGTYTFRAPGTKSSPDWTSPGRQYVTRAAQRLVSLLETNGSTCFVCVEIGSHTRRLHLHSLESLEPRARRVVHDWWGRQFGYEGYRVAASRVGVSSYVAKYVVKSDFPFFMGGPLWKPG